MKRGGLVAWGLAVATGCGGSAPPVPGPPADSAAAVAAPADSLVLTTRSGHQIWFTEGRDAEDGAGGRCYERSVEIRTDSSRIKVPLLYVTSAPTELRPGSVRAELSRACRTMAIYQVDLASGRPTKLEDR